MARVFIGIPTLNRPRFVRDAVHSVLEQTFGDFRLVVSDNDSEAAARESVAGFVEALDDSRVRFHRQPRNVGEYGQGRYFFREVSDEEFFVILHDDDVLTPEYLEKAVRRLEADPTLAWFVANAFLMDAQGKVSASKTRWYRSWTGRMGRPDHAFEALDTVMRGLTPASGTCFRTSALRASGFVDEDCQGNYPFEFNLLLRLAERGARAWFCAEQLLGFRFHAGSMTNYLRLVENPDVIATMILLLERRTFTGANERRRRAVLGRCCRASAVIRAQAGDGRGCRREIARALRANPRSVRTWAFAPLALLAPRLARVLLPARREAPFGPRCTDETNTDYRSAPARDA